MNIITQYKKTKGLTEKKPVKKMGFVTLFALLLLALLFDIVGFIPILSSFVYSVFGFIISIIMWLLGYRLRLAKIVISYLLNFFMDVFFFPWFACTSLVISLYIFNSYSYKKYQEQVKKESAK